MSKHRIFWKSSRRAYRVLIVLCVLALISGIVIFSVNDGFNGFPKEEKGGYTSKSDDAPVRYENTGSEENIDRIENGIHVRTGLVDAPGLRETVNNCTSCHSAKLVIQNRMSAERWHATIRWMQETQNLWPLGENEDIIVNYLVTHYPPQKKGRRAALTDVEWYELNE